MAVKTYLFQIIQTYFEKKIILGPRCLTTNDSPDKNAECKFPWRFNAKLKNECTDEADPNGR